MQDLHALVSSHIHFPQTEEDMQLAAYSPGEAFHLHIDASDVAGKVLIPMTAMIYLQEPSAGGDTVFPFAEPTAVSVPPRVGDLLVWPNCDDLSGHVPLWGRHAGEPVVAGTKIIFNRFFKQNEIPLAECTRLAVHFPETRVSSLWR